MQHMRHCGPDWATEKHLRALPFGVWLIPIDAALLGGWCSTTVTSGPRTHGQGRFKVPDLPETREPRWGPRSRWPSGPREVWIWRLLLLTTWGGASGEEPERRLSAVNVAFQVIAGADTNAEA